MQFLTVSFVSQMLSDFVVEALIDCLREPSTKDQIAEVMEILMLASRHMCQQKLIVLNWACCSEEKSQIFFHLMDVLELQSKLFPLSADYELRDDVDLMKLQSRLYAIQNALHKVLS